MIFSKFSKQYQKHNFLLLMAKIWKPFKELLEQSLKPRALDVYKGKLHLDCYNFIQQCKDYFTTSDFQDCNPVFLQARFSRSKFWIGGINISKK